MKSSIYEYLDYKEFLIDLIENSEGGPRGKRRQLAMSIGAQVSHVSNVLSGTAHFSPEQAEASARFFALDARETEYLLLLIAYNRAGTASLSNFYRRLLKERQEAWGNLKKRLDMPDQLRSEQEATYYRNWTYGAIHVLLSIPQFQTRDAVAQRLNLSRETVDEVLAFLMDAGLVRRNGQRYQLGGQSIHLESSSPMIAQHHTNWRLRSMMNLGRMSDGDLHYSSVMTLTTEDFYRVREILTKALAKSLKLVSESNEEDIACLGIDLFKL